MHCNEGKRTSFKSVFGCLVLCFLLCLPYCVNGQSLPSLSSGDDPEHADSVEIIFINVGKADSALISVQGHNYLIDTGDVNGVIQVLSVLHALDIQSIDGVFLTHTHTDHIGGMELLAQSIPIKSMYASSITTPTKHGDSWFRIFSESTRVPLVTLNAGDTLELGDQVTASVLAPIVFNADDDNDNSLVLRVNAYGRSILFAGDMQFAEEKTLLKTNVDLASDILKVGNHGNRDATSAAFAEAVHPDYVVISTDRSVSPDSANSRVLACFEQSKVYLTESYDLALAFSVDAEKIILPSSFYRPICVAELEIEEIDRKNQTITIRNHGDTTDISDYMLYTEKGSKLFVFPENAVISGGGKVTVSCARGRGDFFWPDKKVWSNKKSDTYSLYSKYGQLISSI